jgi:hypothetical protein
MKIDVATDRTIRLRDVFNEVLFETGEGEKLGVCMRDGGFQISVKDTSIKSERGTEYYRTYKVMGGAVEELNVGPCCESYKGDPEAPPEVARVQPPVSSRI